MGKEAMRCGLAIGMAVVVAGSPLSAKAAEETAPRRVMVCGGSDSGNMSSKERVRVTLAGGPADRVPIDYSANAGIDRRLKRHFGLADDDSEGLRQVLVVEGVY